MATAELPAIPLPAEPAGDEHFPRARPAARAIPGSLVPFWIACAITLIVAHYQLWGRLNIVYKIMSTVVVLMMPFTAGVTRLITRPAVLCLLAFEGVMVANMLIGRYFSWSSLFTTASAPMILIRSLPFLLCGYTLARHLPWQRRILLFVAAIYWLFAIQDARGFIAGARGQLGRAETYTQAQGLEDVSIGGAYVGAFTYFAPLMLFLAIGLLRLYPSLTKPWRFFVIGMQMTFTTAAVLAGFGATTAMAFLAVVLSAIYAPVRTIGWRLYYLGVSGVVFAVFEIMRRTLLAQGGLGAAGGAFAKVTLLVQGLWSMLFGRKAEMLEQASSARWSLMWTSLETFFRNPIAGHGFFGTADTAVGGHSFLVDTAAIFGIIGFLPIALFFWLLYKGLRRSRRLKGVAWTNSSSMIFLLTLMAGLVMNPYFLSLLSLSYFLFLLLGFALADGEMDEAPAARSAAALHRPPSRYSGELPVHASA